MNINTTFFQGLLISWFSMALVYLAGLPNLGVVESIGLYICAFLGIGAGSIVVAKSQIGQGNSDQTRFIGQTDAVRKSEKC